ncbi:MAG: dihydropteroate synthase [Pseudomonadota bacterium]|nr:dihydropteroate synthase [Pseudomonadota bacterium]
MSGTTAATPRLLFLTGRLAEPGLRRILEGMAPCPFSWEVRELGLQVAGLMTADMLRRRLQPAQLAGFDGVVVPGRCRGDLDAVAAELGVPITRGPDEMKDLPRHFGRGLTPPDLSRHEVLIFAEIVDAPHAGIEAIVERARRYRRDGADVIDLGCLPETPFPQLEDAVRALKHEGFRVSVDSLHTDDLRRGARAGADYLLSLSEDTLFLADEVAATPVLIPRTHGDLESLLRAARALDARGRPYLADAILDPIHFGFTESLVRFRDLRKALPQAQIMMGVGNLTELTDADTAGINALLFGVISELRINAVLATEVSPHCASAVREADAARRMMFAARAEDSLPRDFSDRLLALRARRPFPDTPEEIAAMATQVRDPSFRIQVSRAGIHAYNRDGLRSAAEPYALWPQLGLENDAGHAFYMGVELARAHHAFLLGKRYQQDEDLDWGAALPPRQDDRLARKTQGITLTHQLREPQGGPEKP